MEQFIIKFDDAEFDRLVHSGLQQAGPVTIAVKDIATEEGRPGAVISFPVAIDGVVHQAQAVTTVRLLVRFLEALKVRYPDL